MLGLTSQDAKHYLIVAAAYLFLSLLFFWPMVSNITSTVPGAGGDIYQSMWDLWWVPFSIFTLHTTPYFTQYVYHPAGANLATQTLAPIAGLFSAVFQPVSLAFAFNIVFLLGFVLSGLFAYMLAYHVTKNRTASFLAGFIYAFSPMHTIQAFGHVQFTNIEFIPLFFLFFLKMSEENKHTNAIMAGISFVLLTFMGDIEQGLMTILLAFFVLLYLLLAKSHRHKLIRKEFVLHFAEMSVVILVLGFPFIFGIISYLQPSTLTQANVQAGTQYNELYSPDLVSFFVPAYFNGILSFASKSFIAINSPALSERTTYVGFTVLALVLFTLFYEYKEKFKNSAIFFMPLVLFAMLSIGPYLQINGVNTGIPGIYQVYHAIPFFNVLREPGRFDMITELLLGVFVAIGFVHLERMQLSSKVKQYLPAVIFVLLVLEYNSWPISSIVLNNMYTNVQIPQAYSEIGKLAGNFSVLMLPALPNFTNRYPNLYPGLALYYQTAFKKPLVGGYTTRTNVTQLFSLVNMPLVDGAYYLQNGQGLVYGSPIQSNFTNSTIFLLGAYNVGFVSIIRQAYNTSQLESLTSYLSSFLGYPVYQNNDTIVFSTSNITSRAGTVPVEFTPVLFSNPISLWQPGWVLCNAASQQCNGTTSNTWFAADPAYINIFAPSSMRLNISMRIMSPQGFSREQVYFDNQLISTLNLTLELQQLSLNVEALGGRINQLVFVSPTQNLTGYSNVGIMNLTFKKAS